MEVDRVETIAETGKEDYQLFRKNGKNCFLELLLVIKNIKIHLNLTPFSNLRN